MKNSVKNKLAMYKAVKSVIAANSALWVGFPAFEAAYQTFVSKVNLLDQAGYNQATTTIGVRALKNAKRELTAERFNAIASSISAYAVLANKPELIEQMKISKWDILKGNRVKAMQKIDLVLAKAIENLADLPDFGIDQAVVDELQTLRDEMEAHFASPRNAIVNRKTLTGQLSLLRKEVDAILNLQLDKLMEVVKLEHPEFFELYKNARIVVDARSRHRGNSEADDSEEDPSNTHDDEE